MIILVVHFFHLQAYLSVIGIYILKEMETSHNFEEYSGLGKLQSPLIAPLAISPRVYP